jgi:hypothetical protein
MPPNNGSLRDQENIGSRADNSRNVKRGIRSVKEQVRGTHLVQIHPEESHSPHYTNITRLIVVRNCAVSDVDVLCFSKS